MAGTLAHYALRARAIRRAEKLEAEATNLETIARATRH